MVHFFSSSIKEKTYRRYDFNLSVSVMCKTSSLSCPLKTSVKINTTSNSDIHNPQTQRLVGMCSSCSI